MLEGSLQGQDDMVVYMAMYCWQGSCSKPELAVVPAELAAQLCS